MVIWLRSCPSLATCRVQETQGYLSIFNFLASVEEERGGRKQTFVPQTTPWPQYLVFAYAVARRCRGWATWAALHPRRPYLQSVGLCLESFWWLGGRICGRRQHPAGAHSSFHFPKKPFLSEDGSSASQNCRGRSCMLLYEEQSKM